MRITGDLVSHIASLAKLRLSEKEKELYAEQLTRILDHVAVLSEVEEIEIEEMGEEQETPFREDLPSPGAPSHEFLSSAPSSLGPYFKVPKVIE